jgi:hypothetical protein
MFKKLMMFLPMFLLTTFEARAEQPASPGSALPTELALSGPYNVSDLDPELQRLFQDGTKDRGGDFTTLGSDWWYDSAIGPRPTSGGVFYYSDPMYAYTNPGAIMQTLQYYWDNTRLGGWVGQVIVMVYVTNGTTAYAADVTSQNSGTLNASGIPANYSVYIRMQVGYVTGGLYNPPSIPYVTSRVDYTY